MIKTVLHDWPDADVVRILQQIAAAMTPGYSSLLIVEQILPDDEPVSLQMSALDMILMVAYAGMERSETQWRTVIAEAGLQIKNMWMGKGGDGVIEAIVENKEWYSGIG